MSRDSFIKDVLPWAKQASDRTDVPVSVVLAHWGHETGWGTSRAWIEDHNPAGLMSGGRPIHFNDTAGGVASYIRTLLNPRYTAVRAAKSPEDTIVALGRSQYDADHYGGDGRLVLNTWKTLDAQKYDNTGSPSLIDRARDAVRPIAKIVAPEALTDTGPTVGDVVGGAKKLGNAASTTADLVGFFTGQGLRRVVIGGVLVAGGVGLVVAGAWRGFVPDDVRSAVGKVGKLAAVA